MSMKLDENGDHFRLNYCGRHGRLTCCFWGPYMTTNCCHMTRAGIVGGVYFRFT